ncbi:hypothetical protein [Burkholderia vietnamiensis]|uniref:hypothetical protein n=1 Tax=Burkholderia vietnamiensis TaxID=60552 RepID=UPI000A501686|nr:hypothetical protein [Burkholderia vietnamiensis]
MKKFFRKMCDVDKLISLLGMDAFPHDRSESALFDVEKLSGVENAMTFARSRLLVVTAQAWQLTLPARAQPAV